jgi:peptide-methionine (S)-S-oxide reductase
MSMFFSSKKSRMPRPEEALPGRSSPMRVGEQHFVSGHRIVPPFPDGHARAMFGMGCFWGAERKFWEVPGVYATAVGYAAGVTPNPTYEEVCSGLTGHNEVVLVIYDPAQVSYEKLLQVFWEAHDPTQGMRQGNDAGTQYRSGIYAFDAAQLRRPRRRDTSSAWPRRVTPRSRPRSSRPPSSITPRTITSNTSARTRAVTAGSVAPASRVTEAR